MARLSASLLLSLPLSAVAFAQSATPGPRPAKPAGLTSYLTGNAADKVVDLSAGPALLLMGGTTEVDKAFTQRAYPVLSGGDILVLRTSGSDGYNDYMYSELVPSGPLKPDSVETLLLKERSHADSDYVVWAVDTAEMIWFAGGDQSDYLNAWGGTRTQEAVQRAWDRGAVIGGTSAGLAILGEHIYDPDGVSSAVSETVLQDPYDSSVMLSGAFLDTPWLEGTITDTHFKERDRMGRTLAFMARLRQDGTAGSIRAIAVSERTSLFIDKDGQAVADGRDAAYIISEGPLTVREQVAPGQPLVYRNLLRVRLADGDTYDFARHTSPVPAMTLSVDGRATPAFSPADPYAAWTTENGHFLMVK